MDRLRRQIRKRFEHEESFVQPRVRQRQDGRRDDDVVVQQKIQIERPRAISNRSLASESIFNLLARRQEIRGRR